MDEFIYDQLSAALTRKGGPFPAIKSPTLKNILEAIFTDDYAGVAIAMPDAPVTAEEMAKLTGRDPGDMLEILEKMAKRGILFSMKIGEKRIYNLFPLIPGILENQVVSGAVNDHTRKISILTDEYLELLKELETSDSGRLPRIPFSRVIAVEEDISSGASVQPYDRLLEYVDKLQYFAQVACHCRHIAELTGNPCSKPKDVCLAVGPGARYMIEYGLGKAITKEEAINTLKRAEAAGLVHVVSNTGKNIDFICNCCSCHCDNMKAFKRFADYGRAARSSFAADVRTDFCVACGNCLERCPMEAISLQNDVAVVDKKGCIGCGLCVSTCPAEAIVLQNREHAPVPYADARQLNKAIALSIEKKE